MSFDHWIHVVNRHLRKKGITADDIPDAPFHQMHQRGASPKEAADIAIAEYIPITGPVDFSGYADMERYQGGLNKWDASGDELPDEQ